MLRLSCAASWLVLLPLAAGCGRRVSEPECLKLLDHYTELLAREEQPEASPETIAQMKDAARLRARHDETFEFGRCSAEVNRRQFECAMAAASVDSLERCLIL